MGMDTYYLKLHISIPQLPGEDTSNAKIDKALVQFQPNNASTLINMKSE